MKLLFFYILALSAILLGCAEKKEPITTPWGTTLGEDTIAGSKEFSLDDVLSNGEMIMLTMSGPDTYFDYHGRGMGTQYLLCEKFAQHLGVSLRVELCKDTAEMVERLKKGEGDIVAYQLPESIKGLRFCGYGVDSLHTSWAVNKGNNEFADSLSKWFDPKMIAQIKREENFFYSTRSVKRHTYAPMLNASAGIISKYDHLFMRYAPVARWDWRLLAAQCYQESTFDPQAISWAGACGLMQIMPSTADEIGLSRSQLHDPEQNIAAAARYINNLSGRFRDVRNPDERRWFVLASYNGGSFHIRDAMALARKNGRDQYRWDDVSEFVLKLSMPQYYRDPIVKHGYMRGQETVGYVERIRDRWAQYRGVARGGSFPSIGSPSNAMPQKAHRKHRFKL